MIFSVIFSPSDSALSVKLILQLWMIKRNVFYKGVSFSNGLAFVLRATVKWNYALICHHYFSISYPKKLLSDKYKNKNGEYGRQPNNDVLPANIAHGTQRTAVMVVM